ncbi:MAG: 1-phosphofructokinase family hexose kinase [Deltaproteobacteria bacterium]|jgi:1-phosphofructokinase|nr:1-phosphofructokinase family hexose kinase [Deltaproteobacteria bacterium]
MIYTLTLNPAVDYLVHLDALTPGAVNRGLGERVMWGGKGINVSRVLNGLGFDTVALGFIAGFTGQALKQGLRAIGIRTDFIELQEGLTRINVKVRAKEGTEISGSGPAVNSEAVEALISRVTGLNQGDVLVMAGNVPPNVGQDIYERLLTSLSGHGVMVVVDASGEALRRVLKHKPSLVKPTLADLNEICGQNAVTDGEIIENAKRFQAMGAQNVLVSMPGQGALLVQANGQTHRVNFPRGQIKGLAGAADSLVAGYLSGLMWDFPTEKALALGAAAESATAFSEGLATAEEIAAVYASAYGLTLPKPR